MSNFPHDRCAKGHPVQQGVKRQRCAICQLAYTHAYRARQAATKKPTRKQRHPPPAPMKTHRAPDVRVARDR